MNARRNFTLCATDFSRSADEAALVAAKLALRRSESLRLVHVVDGRSELARASLHERLTTRAKRLARFGAAVEPLLLDGTSPVETMISYVREHAPSMVVVGGALKGPLDRWAFGSFSERLAETVCVPTLVVRNAAAFESWDVAKLPLTVLLSLDLHASSDVVLRWAKQFQKAGPCRFIACHVNWRVPTAEEAVDVLARLANPPEKQAHLERDLRRKIRDQMADDTMEVIVRPFFDEPGLGLVKIAEERKAPLIAVGAHQRRGIHRLAQFSVSRDILHVATANVMCVPVSAQFDAREAHIPEYRRILVATDFSELGNTAIPHAFAACERGGKVKIVHVVSSREAARRGSSWRRTLRDQLRGLIPDEIEGRCSPPEVDLLEGEDPAEAICAETGKFGADLVCLASHGLGASRALHGSTARAVLKRIDRPLLIVRRPEG